MATKSNSRRKTTTPSRAQPTGDGAPTGESLEQVRDILFGGQMRSVESRLERIETRIMREVDAARSEAATRADALETLMKKEFKAAAEKLQTERAKRTAELKAIATELRDTAKELDKRLTALDTETSHSDAELRDQIVAQAKALSTQLKERFDEVMDELRRESHELRSEKADTTSLIALFSDMALRLTEELPAPQQD